MPTRHIVLLILCLLVAPPVMAAEDNQDAEPAVGDQPVTEQTDACFNKEGVSPPPDDCYPPPRETLDVECVCEGQKERSGCGASECVDCDQSVLQKIQGFYNHIANEYVAGGQRSGLPGCVSCGAGSNGDSGLPCLELVRYHTFRMPEVTKWYSSFGPNVGLRYDSQISVWFREPGDMYPTDCAFFFPSFMGNAPFAQDRDPVTNSYTHDGVVDPYANLVEDVRFYDASGNLTNTHSEAVRGVVTRHNGEIYDFEMISIYATGHSLGRLTAITNKNGESVRIEYVNPAPALGSNNGYGDTTAGFFQKSRIVDAHGRAAVFHYGTTRIGAGFPVTRIDLPNGSSIQYSYNTDPGDLYGLVGISYPDGTTSTFSATNDATTQCLKVSIDDAGADSTHRRKTVYLTQSTWTDPVTNEVVSQPENRVRIVRNGAGELTYAAFYETIPNTSEYYVYTFEGGNRMQRMRIDSGLRPVEISYATSWSFSTPRTDWVFEDAENDKQWSGTRVTRLTDPYGRWQSMEFEGKKKPADNTTIPNEDFHGSELPVKIGFFDGTSYSTARNGFAQTTRQVDRLGRVTTFSYDGNGNLTGDGVNSFTLRSSSKAVAHPKASPTTG